MNPVGIDITVVPDGSPRAGRQRLSLRVVPRPVGEGYDGPTVDLAEWPQQIAAMEVRLWGGKLHQTGSSGTKPEYRVDRIPFSGPLHRDLADHPERASMVDDATALWRKVFAPERDPRGFDAFLEALRDQGGNGAFAAAGRIETTEYSEALLSEGLHKISATRLASLITGRLHLQRVNVPLDTDASMRPPVEWWRTVHEEWLSPPRNEAEHEAVRKAGSVARSEADVRMHRSAFRQAVDLLAHDEAQDYTLAAFAAVRSTFRNEIGNFRRAWGIDADQVHQPEDGLQDSDPPRAITKLSSILAHPVLAKYFQLLVDVEIEDEAARALLPEGSVGCRGRTYGALAAELVPRGHLRTWGSETDPASLHWTAAVLKDDDGTGAYFGPCGSREALRYCPSDDDEFRDGVLNLAIRKRGDARFSLVTEDTTQSIAALINDAAGIAEAEREGRLPADQSTRLPERTGSGITLLDEGLTDQHWAEVREDASGDQPTGHRVSFAADLVEGYRIDVALSNRVGDWRDPGRWRSLVARDLSFPGDHINPHFLQATEGLRDRDDGRVRTPPGVRQQTEGGIVSTVLVEDKRVFSWRGESLGIPSLQHDEPLDEDDTGERATCIDETTGLAIDIVYSLPEPRHGRMPRRPPPLREGRSYMVGARACWVNGCGLSLDDAVTRYTRFPASVVLGENPTTPFRLVRHAELQAPDVLLPWNDRLVRARTPEREVPGESVETLVVRSGDAMDTQSAWRILVPGRVSADAAEQAGAFEERRRRQPIAAFMGSVRFRASRRGAFPVARDGRWEVLDHSDAPMPEGGPPPQRSRGLVFVPNPDAALPDQLYFPDPLAREVCARFVGDEALAGKRFKSVETAEFWVADGHPSDAVPIVLELRRASRQELDGRNRRFARRGRARLEQLGGGTLHLPRLAVELAPGEEVELELWPLGDLARLAEAHVTFTGARALLASEPIRKKLARSPVPQNVRTTTASEQDALQTELAEVAAMTPNAYAMIGRVLRLGPIPQINNRRRVRLVHAVDRPLRAPVVVNSARDPGRTAGAARKLAAVVITIDAAAAPGGEATRSWDRYVAAHRDVPVDAWESEPNGTTTFFVGKVRLDRPSTIKLRADASWEEFEPSGVQQDEDTGLWSFRPRPVPPTQLFAVENVEMREDLRGRPLSLLRNDSNGTPESELRALSYSFPDGKARRLELGLIATSRYSGYFEPVPTEGAESSPRVGRYERASESSEELWVPATIRPRAPRVDRIVPLFRWETTGCFFDHRITWNRKSLARIYLARDSRFSSGEGERLAVAFGPYLAETGEPLDLRGFEEAVGEFAQFLTRWGTDPIHRSFALPDVVAPHHVGGSDVHPGLQLPFGLDATVIEVTPACAAEVRLPAGAIVTIRGTNFIPGATVTVNGVDAHNVEVLPSEIRVRLASETVCPLNVAVRNPSLTVTIKSYEPRLDFVEGLWYCDLDVQHGDAYFPFVQLGLAHHQPHAAPGLELSTPVTEWIQILPERRGSVTIGKDRRVVVEHRGIGYGRTPGDEATAERDAPLLNLRLLRATSEGRVPHNAAGEPAWLPVLDGVGAPIEKLRARPIAQTGAEAWWSETFELPSAKAGTRYGLLIEEIELMRADPDPVEHPERYITTGGVLTVAPVDVERGPMFGHIVDLGE